MVATVSSQAQIWTEDKLGDNVTDFAPAENVYIRGSGFNSNAQIDISVTRPDNVENISWETSDENGNFLYIYTLDGIQGIYQITATDGVNSAIDNFDDCSYHLEGYDKTAARWERGLLEGWEELDWVPYRILFSDLRKGTTSENFNVYHNNLLQGNLGFDQLINFRVGDVNGNPVNGSVTTSGPFYKTPGKNSDRDIYYSLSVTFTTTSSGFDWYVYWDAHLAVGSSGWPGAKLHAYADITGTQTVPIKVPPVPVGSISGSKWNDQNFNGIWDPGEPGLSGWTINLTGPISKSTLTDNNGCYKFNGLTAGTYTVSENLKVGWIQTFPSSGSYSITLSARENRSGINFGNVSAVYGVSVSISPFDQGGFDGEIVIYTVTVVNVGNVTDTYNINASDNLGWNNIWLDDNALQVAGFDNENTTLHVRIPDNAVYCTRDNVTVTAISQTDSTVKDNDSCIAHATSIIVVDVSISPLLDSGLHKDVTITNMGNVIDNYNLAVKDNSGWTLMLVENQFGNVIPGENRVTALDIDIPENTRSGKVDCVTVVATSKEHAGVSDNATADIPAIRGVEVSISPTENEGLHGDRLVYTVTVRNIGNVADNYYLTKSDVLGWVASENFAWLSVAPGHFDSVNFEVIIPENVRPGIEDVITITATSQIDNTISDSDNCVARAKIIRGANVSISPVENEALAGENLTFAVTITNTGNVPDNYALENIDTLGWSLSLSKSSLENILDGASGNVTLTVTIPDNAWGRRAIDDVTVIATSLENENAEGSGTCLAGVKVIPGAYVRITPGWQENLFGGNLAYIVTVVNTGNAVDNYTLSAIDAAGWGLSFSDNLVGDNRIENLAPGENRVVALLVTISEDWMGYTDDGITVTATSNENAAISNNASCVAHGIPCTGTASIRPAITGPVPYLWGTSKAKVTADLKIYTGGNLRLRFLAADNKTVESEAVVWGRTMPGEEYVSFTDRSVLHDNHLPYPVGIIKRVKMVLTDNAGNVILDNMAWYTPVQNDWGNRVNWIVLNWSSHTGAEQDQLGNEITQIVLNWSNTPIIRDQWDFFKVFP